MGEYQRRTLSREPADESNDLFTKYCINQIEIAYVVVFGTTLGVGLLSAFYIARFRFEMTDLLIKRPTFKPDLTSFLNNNGLLSRDITRVTEKTVQKRIEENDTNFDEEADEVKKQEEVDDDISSAETNAWLQLQIYKKTGHDYYYNEDDTQLN